MVGGVGQFAVKLVSQFAKDVVAFEIMPTISESHSVSYEDIVIAHHPGTIAKYAHTGSRTWSVSNIILASRNSDEATKNQITLNILRSWSQPFYGYGTEKTNPNELGAPPEVLTFTAYGDKNIGPINVVLESLSFEWPNDCDYLHTADGQPFPVLLHLTLSLKESWSPKEYSGFDLMAYKTGNMTSAYNKGNVNTSAGGESVTSGQQGELEAAQKIADSAPENAKSQMDQLSGGLSGASSKVLGEIKSNPLLQEMRNSNFGKPLFGNKNNFPNSPLNTQFPNNPLV